MIYTIKTKEEADKMRALGKPYALITERLGIPKSTLSTWFNKKYASVYKEKQYLHLKKARVFATIAKKKKVLERSEELTEKTIQEVLNYPKEDLGFMKMTLASLYWAEGAKHAKVSGLIFVNTDPNLVDLYVTLLRKCFLLDETRFRVRLHIHDYHDKKECLQFWSKLLKIDKKYFYSPYIKSRSKTKKFRRNFMGICTLVYLNSDIRRELLEIGKQVQLYYCK